MTKAKITEVFEDIEMRARDNATTYTKADTEERYYAQRDSAYSALDDMAGNIDDVTYNTLKKMIEKNWPRLRSSKIKIKRNKKGT